MSKMDQFVIDEMERLETDDIDEVLAVLESEHAASDSRDNPEQEKL